ncbi:hypothetical protein SNEBB_005061 [Seison nebaliae]|nr:hypothetical protein SNEBB_005061 [Seison nebaliae]
MKSKKETVTKLETVVVIKPTKILATVCAIIACLLLAVALSSTNWLTASGIREGLFMNCSIPNERIGSHRGDGNEIFSAFTSNKDKNNLIYDSNDYYSNDGIKNDPSISSSIYEDDYKFDDVIEENLKTDHDYQLSKNLNDHDKIVDNKHLSMEDQHIYNETKFFEKSKNIFNLNQLNIESIPNNWQEMPKVPDSPQIRRSRRSYLSDSFDIVGGQSLESIRQIQLDHHLSEDDPSSIESNNIDKKKHLPNKYEKSCRKVYFILWLQLCTILLVGSNFFIFISVVLMVIGLIMRRSSKKGTLFSVASLILTLAVLCLIAALILFPAMFVNREMEKRNRGRWYFGWAYGVAWGSSFFVIASIILARWHSKDEIYFVEKEKPIQKRGNLSPNCDNEKYRSIDKEEDSRELLIKKNRSSIAKRYEDGSEEI